MVRTNIDQDYNDDKEIKKSHHFISLKKKQKLIELVEKGNLSIYKAAQRLKICHPTAKFIMKSHRKSEGLSKPEERILNHPNVEAPPTQEFVKTLCQQNSPDNQQKVVQKSEAVQNMCHPEQKPFQPPFLAYYCYDYFLPSLYYM